MDVFRKSTDYFGQDIHVWRNSKAFPLYKLFESSGISFDFRIPLNSNNKYENITILNIATPEIQADPYVSNPNEPKITNFYMRVTDTASNTTVGVLIHVHDNLDKIWLSPSNISFRSGMNAKYGVLANFTDGIYADLSFYPEMKKNLTNGTSYLSIPPDSSGDDPRRITWKADPPNNNPIIDAITIELPIWMENSGSSNRIQVKGNIKVLDEFGTLNFHNGDITDVNERVNILFLCDGFDGSDDADLSTFHEIINEHNKQMLMKRSYAPWNLLSNKVNTWSYYTQDTNKYSSLESEYIFVKNDSVTTTPTVAELYRFLYFFDNIIMFYLTSTLTQTVDDFIEERKSEFSPALIDFLDFKSSNLASQFPLISQPGVNAGDFLKLSELCSCVGLPSQADSNDINTKYTQWGSINLNWADDFVVGNPAVGKKFLHPYVFEIWTKLKKRIFLEKSDTSYGVSNCHYQLRPNRQVRYTV